MRVIPVIDLQGGLVVRGLRGQREQYRPIESCLAADATPRCVALGFVERLGLRTAYVADLDAIADSEPAWAIYEQLLDCGLELWVDAGIRDVNRACRLAQWQTGGRRIAAVIAGLESLSGPETLAGIVESLGPQRLIFSLDLRDGVPIHGGPGWQGADAWQTAQTVRQLGVRRMIVLDLARVGAGEGIGTESLCRRLRASDRALEIIAGGGVRCAGDLSRMAHAGCNAALVASALHDGRLTQDDLESLGSD